MRDVLRHAVHYLNDAAIGHAIDRRVIAKITGVFILGTGPGRRTAIDYLIFNPVDGVALRDIRLAVIEENRPPMGRVGIIVGGIAGDPAGAAQRRRDYQRSTR